MSTKYLDYSGLSYFWSKLKNYLATTTHSGLMSATDKTKVDMITTDGTIAFYRKEESVYVTETADEDTIPIGISGFTTADMLLVDINGLDLSEGEEYVISGTNIVLDTPIGTIGTVVHFVVLRAITATAADVATLKGEKGEDGVVQDVLQNGVSVLGPDGIARIVSGTSDYDSLTNRPQINSVTLTGNKSFADLGLIDFFYPVGSYYETSDSTFDPNTAWGGTWEKETQGQVHVSSGSNYAVSGANNNTSDGGSKDAVVIYHTHKVSSGWQTASGQPDRITYGGVNGGYNNAGYGNVQFLEGVGVAGTDKNMPPYIVVNRWHRTA